MGGFFESVNECIPTLDTLYILPHANAAFVGLFDGIGAKCSGLSAISTSVNLDLSSENITLLVSLLIRAFEVISIKSSDVACIS